MSEGQDFIIKIIQYLEYKYGITFFVTTRDFDALYSWWEKRIPLLLVKESITNVVSRFKEKNKNIRGFSTFRYEVRKNFKAFLQLSVGSEREEENTAAPAEKSPFADIDRFLRDFPPELVVLKGEFEDLYARVKNNETPDPTPVLEKLPELFKEDHELNVKTTLFLRNLAPELRKPDIEQRYRRNYIVNKFNIPDFA